MLCTGNACTQPLLKHVVFSCEAAFLYGETCLIPTCTTAFVVSTSSAYAFCSTLMGSIRAMQACPIVYAWSSNDRLHACMWCIATAMCHYSSRLSGLLLDQPETVLQPAHLQTVQIPLLTYVVSRGVWMCCKAVKAYKTCSCLKTDQIG